MLDVAKQRKICLKWGNNILHASILTYNWIKRTNRGEVWNVGTYDKVFSRQRDPNYVFPLPLFLHCLLYLHRASIDEETNSAFFILWTEPTEPTDRLVGQVTQPETFSCSAFCFKVRQDYSVNPVVLSMFQKFSIPFYSHRRRLRRRRHHHRLRRWRRFGRKKLKIENSQN